MNKIKELMKELNDYIYAQKDMKCELHARFIKKNDRMIYDWVK